MKYYLETPHGRRIEISKQTYDDLIYHDYENIFIEDNAPGYICIGWKK